MDKDLTGVKPLLTHNNRPRGKRVINDNYCVNCVASKDYCACVTGKVETTRKDMTRKGCLIVANSTETRTHSFVNCGVVKLVPFAGRLPQKKGLNPDHHIAINTVKGVSCVNQLSSVNCVTNVPTFVPDLPVGARLLQF